MPNVIGPVASVHQEVQSQFQVLDPEKCALMKGNGYWICLKISYSKSSACSYHPFSLRSRMTQILRHLETFSTSALPASPASPLSVAGGVPKSWASWHSESWVESTVSESLRHQINSGTMWNWAAWEGSSNYYVESDESVDACASQDITRSPWIPLGTFWHSFWLDWWLSTSRASVAGAEALGQLDINLSWWHPKYSKFSWDVRSCRAAEWGPHCAAWPRLQEATGLVQPPVIHPDSPCPGYTGI